MIITIRVIFVMMILTCYCLLFTEQRIDVRKKSLEVLKLTQHYDFLNARKQELITLIEKERVRLVHQAHHMGRPLSPNDIVVME